MKIKYVNLTEQDRLNRNKISFIRNNYVLEKGVGIFWIPIEMEEAIPKSIVGITIWAEMHPNVKIVWIYKQICDDYYCGDKKHIMKTIYRYKTKPKNAKAKESSS